MSQIYLHKQADVPTMVGILSPAHGTPQEVADKLLLIAEFDYIDFDETAGMSGMFIIKYGVSEDVEAMLERYQYPLPMVVVPLTITDNRETGYETIRGLVILNGSSWFKDKDVCLDHLNAANAVALEIDFDIVKSLQGSHVVPVRKIGEEFEDFRKRQKQAHIFFTSSLDVMNGLRDLSDSLYLTHKFDRRGRCYASGYHVNTQGTDYNKAVLQFSKKELVNG